MDAINKLFHWQSIASERHLLARVYWAQVLSERAAKNINCALNLQMKIRLNDCLTNNSWQRVIAVDMNKVKWSAEKSK